MDKKIKEIENDIQKADQHLAAEKKNFRSLDKRYAILKKKKKNKISR